MKKLVAFFFTVLTSASLIAQETQDKAKENITLTIYGESGGEAIWKGVFLAVFTLVILIFVIRTFRGKAEI